MASRDLTINILGKNDSAKKALSQTSSLTSKFGLDTSSASSAVAGGWAAAATAIVAFGAKSIATYTSVGSEVLKVQRYTGESAEGASRLRFAAQQSGVDIDQFTKSLGFLSKNLVNKPQEFANYGIATKDATGKSLEMHDVLLNTATAFQQMQNGPEKTAMALKLFGKAGADMIPFLNRGREGVEALEKQTDEYGMVLSGKNLQDVKKSKEAQRELAAAFQGLQVMIGQRLLPTVTEFTGELTSLVKIGGKIPDLMDSINDATGGWASKLQKITDPTLISQFKGIADSIYSLKNPADNGRVSFEQLNAATGASKEQMEAWNVELEKNGTTFDRDAPAIKAFTEYVNDQTTGTDAATESTQTFTQQIDEANKSLKDAQDELQGATDNLNKWFDTISANIDLEASYQQSVDDLTHSFWENGNTLDLNTQQGRDNMKAVEDVRTAILNKAKAVVDETGSVKAGTDAAALYTQSLYNQMVQSGFSKDAAKRYIDQLGLTPDKVETAFQASGLQHAIADVDYYRRQLSDLNGRFISVAVLTQFRNSTVDLGVQQHGSGVTHRAIGGPVSAGQPYMVGEKGQELFVPKVDGSIMTAADTRNAMTATGGTVGGTGQNIVIHVGGSLVLERDLLGLLAKAQANGYRPSRMS